MKVLVVGSGGREHALIWKLRQSPRVSHVYCAPGNAGIAETAELVAVRADDVAGLLRFARQNAVDLTVVGPELPLTLGIADEFQRHGLRIFGPDRQAAELEGSKAFAKDLLRRQKIPTGYFGTFADADEAKQYLAEVGAPIVVKADGLAAGKGVVLCRTLREAEAAVDEIMQGRLYGDAGNRVVIEEFLEGEEASFMVITDGTTAVPLASSQDHKAAYDGDQGPNTGGMGTVSPTTNISLDGHKRIMQDIVLPTIAGLAEEGRRFQGVLFAGLMITEAGPKVLEFNARFGDPETQVIMARMRSDVVPILQQCATGALGDTRIEWAKEPAVCVVLASRGYPEAPETGKLVSGLDTLKDWSDVVVYHAATRREDGAVKTVGGRVLGVTALGANLESAIARVYEAIGRIEFDGMLYRRDIGARALARLHGTPKAG
jgi:phosphoribosylamine--glycine ligase